MQDTVRLPRLTRIQRRWTQRSLLEPDILLCSESREGFETLPCHAAEGLAGYMSARTSGCREMLRRRCLYCLPATYVRRACTSLVVGCAWCLPSPQSMMALAYLRLFSSCCAVLMEEVRSPPTHSWYGHLLCHAKHKKSSSMSTAHCARTYMRGMALTGRGSQHFVIPSPDADGTYVSRVDSPARGRSC